VTVVKVERRDVPVDLQVIGNVEAYSAIAVKAQVGGILTKVHFQEGDYVKEGDLLFTIDARPLKAQLQQVEANLARNTAQLRQAEANLARDIAQEQYAKAQANRYERLMQEGVISKEQSEQTRTNADAVAQGVSADRAAIESVKADTGAIQATIENIKLQLNYTEIRSPHRRPHRQPRGQTGQRRQRQHCGHDDHQPGAAHLRDVFGAGIAIG
jgi:multidrug efflux system membrane fusion protein